MLLSEFGIYWVWVLLTAWWGLRLADKTTRQSLWNLGVDLWGLLRVQWDTVSYQKETEPVGKFFKGVLASLLKSGFKGATASVYPKFSKRRITFRKYIRAIGEYGIELRFPGDKWALDYIEKVRTYCEIHHIAYRIETDTGETSREIVCVDFVHDVEAAANLTQGIWTEIFGLSEDARAVSTHTAAFRPSENSSIIPSKR